MREIRKTKSVCPKCLTKIDAEQVEIGNRLYLVKECKTHGIYKVLISKDPKNYKRRKRAFVPSFKTKEIPSGHKKY
mgnify:CR=1 FL=1